MRAPMSPRGRLNVALAGLTTRAWAVFLTLLDAAAQGRARTNTAEPTTVATRQTGRTTRASAAASTGSVASSAELETTPPRPTASTQIAVNTLALIALTFGDRRGVVEHILRCCRLRGAAQFLYTPGWFAITYTPFPLTLPSPQGEGETSATQGQSEAFEPFQRRTAGLPLLGERVG